MLDQAIKTQLTTHLDTLTQAVELVLYQNDSKLSGQLKTFACEVSGLSRFITVSGTLLTEGKPRLAFRVESGRELVAFAGVSFGYEFTSFVLALLYAGGHPISLSDEERVAIDRLQTPLALEPFVSLSCQNCPGVVQMINKIAFQSRCCASSEGR